MFVLILFCLGQIKSVFGPFPTREEAKKYSDDLNFGKFGKAMFLHRPIPDMIETEEDLEDLGGKS